MITRKTLLLLGAVLTPAAAIAEQDACDALGLGDKNQIHASLQTAINNATAQGGGLDLPMWATLVDASGIVCAVATSGANPIGDAWRGSRAISAQKANTASLFNLQNLALSTANLWAPTRNSGSLAGLQESNPVDAQLVNKGPAARYGATNDPFAGRRVGGVNIFGGGLGLYADGGGYVGGVGVSGDTSCADHNIAWLVRHELDLNHLSGVGGVSGDAARPDNIVYDITDEEHGRSLGGFGHPECSAASTGIAAGLPPVQ